MFGKKKQQVIKFDQNTSRVNVTDNSILFVKVSDIVTDSKALLEVPHSHHAFLIKGGGDCRFYKSGVHEIFDDKKEVKAWKKGISTEVVYMPKETNVEILWGTRDKVRYRDAISNKVVEVGARGKFAVTISNYEKFFRKIVGARTVFDLVDFSKRFASIVVDEFADVFLHIVEEEKLSYDRFDINRRKIATKMGDYLSAKFDEDYGISMVDFLIEQFAISAEDVAKVEDGADENRREAAEAEKIKEAKKELERLDDKEWERKKYLLQLEQEKNLAYYDVLKATGGKDVKKPTGANFCPKCGHSCETTAEFCSNCGSRMGSSTIVCPDCKKVNKGDAAFCSGCGKKLN